jgi:hypothetical protein
LGIEVTQAATMLYPDPTNYANSELQPLCCSLHNPGVAKVTRWP